MLKDQRSAVSASALIIGKKIGQVERLSSPTYSNPTARSDKIKREVTDQGRCALFFAILLCIS